MAAYQTTDTSPSAAGNPWGKPLKSGETALLPVSASSNNPMLSRFSHITMFHALGWNSCKILDKKEMVPEDGFGGVSLLPEGKPIGTLHLHRGCKAAVKLHKAWKTFSTILMEGSCSNFVLCTSTAFCFHAIFLSIMHMYD